MERDALLGRIRNRLALETGALDIVVEVIDNAVRLSGEVDNFRQRKAAVNALRDVVEGRDIIDHLSVREIRRPDGQHEMIKAEERYR